MKRLPQAPEFDPMAAALSTMFEQIDNASRMTSLSNRYRQRTIYFQGYLHGLELAVAILKEALKHGNA